MSKIISIATNVPEYEHDQKDLLVFMQTVYQKDDIENRKLNYLFNHSGIQKRYSVIKDFSLPQIDWKFFPTNKLLEPFPTIEDRMKLYKQKAIDLAAKTIEDCIENIILSDKITHLITVSCTGMSAPGLDLEIVEAMQLQNNIGRTSINFMGCYAAVHALKMADAIISQNKNANIIIVCVEFCTIHFQKEYTIDNITANLLFADGCAAVLLQNNDVKERGIVLQNFYSEIIFKGKKDMAWEISSKGFLMTLSSYISNLVLSDFEQLVSNALKHYKADKKIISHWCIHPGGKKILESVQKSIEISTDDLKDSYTILNNYGNMSSPTILFVLQKQMDEIMIENKVSNIFGAAFGPGLTMETFYATYK